MLFFVKLQTLNLQLCWKINSTTNIFQLIYLPFKSNCLSRKTSKKRVWILTCNVHYVTQSVLLLIFSCCSLYHHFTNDQPFTKQGWITWMDSICFQVRSIKKKTNTESTVWKLPMESIIHEYNMSLLMSE